MPVHSRLVARFGPGAIGAADTAGAGGAAPSLRADVSAETPLELRGPFPPVCRGLPPRYLLRNVTAGILDGDDYTIDVCVASGARVAIEPTSAAKAFRTTSDPAMMRTRIEVMPGAELHYDAGLLIPHAGAALRQVTEIVLHETARLSWSEALSFGRISSGERFRFARIENELRILDAAGHVRFERRSDLVPERDRDALESAVGRFSAVGSIVLVGDGLEGFTSPERSDAYAGTSPLPDALGAIVQVLGAWPEQVEAVLGATRAHAFVRPVSER